MWRSVACRNRGVRILRHTPQPRHTWHTPEDKQQQKNNKEIRLWRSKLDANQTTAEVSVAAEV